METYHLDLIKWSSNIYASARELTAGLKTRRIAENKGYDPEELSSQLAEWLFTKQEYLAGMAAKATNPDNYLTTALNNKSRDIVNRWATDEYCNRDRYIYDRDFIKTHKLNILDDVYQPDSLSHVMQCDMQIALAALNQRQRDAFLTTKHDDSTDESQRRRDAAMRSKAERLVWEHMNSYAYARGVDNDRKGNQSLSHLN